MGRFHRHDDGTTHPHDHVDGLDHGNDDGHPHAVGDHSAYATGSDRVTVLERIFTENDRAADANRRAFADAGVFCLNLMSSPGAGKTTVLAATLAHLRERGVRAGVVEGDIETSIDADRLRGLAQQISLVNTGNGFGGECHLDAPMVARALQRLDLDDLDVVLVENIGNLVCPAEFDVGAHRRVMVCSVTEGEDKPLKYPVMFRSVDAVLVNKTDLLPHLDLDVDLLERNVRAVNPSTEILRMSARSGAGLDAWYAWLAGALSA
jgi:hydrogenase nickel incorporation protein HypB